MSMGYRYGRPALKASVDVQLQTAFEDGNWNTVIRLAARRAATLKDPYYEAIKICAEAQLDGSADRSAVLTAVDELVKNKKVPDIDILELYEWACRDFIDYDIEYADTFGPLRVRWVKANPKSPIALQSLQACVERWDLVSAQQIATTLDKTYANTSDRRFMFWNITLTFLLSISPQCSDTSRKVYSLLAAKQLERAADLTENSPKLESTDRGLVTEEEVCLYYRVLLRQGAKAEFISRLQSPKLGALSQLKQGHKLLFCEALDALEKWGEWELIFTLCRDALKLGLDGETTLFFVCDLRIWRLFATAASKVADSESAVKEVKEILDKFLEAKPQAIPLYRKNISLAVLETTFRLPAINQNQADSSLSPRVEQLGLFLDQYFDKLAAFDDVKGYVSELSFEEMQGFLDVLPGILDENTSKARLMALKALECRLRYLLTTCPQTLTSQSEGSSQCLMCSNQASLPCEHCLRKIVVEASAAYNEINSDKEILEHIPTLDKDPRLDLAFAIAMSLLKLSGLRPRTSDPTSSSLWQDVNPGLFLQAVLLLDSQLKFTPNNVELRLLLVQLYLLLGCASYAYQLWNPLGVKRTIQDALSPLFFDRISSLSPGLFQGSVPPTEKLRSFYNQSLRDNSPVRIWDAFLAGSYTSILDMSEYDSRLRRSCTLMMTVVEERRARRCYGARQECEIEAHPLLDKITHDTVLVDKTDYGPFPNLESPHGPPIHEYLRLGPGLSNERSHLAFLAEQYMDLLSYKPPKDFKANRPNEVAVRDREYTLDTLDDLSASLTDFINAPNTYSFLTPAERTYYTIISLLSSALFTALSSPRSEPVSKSLSSTTASIKKAFNSLRTTLSPTPNSPASLPALTPLTNLHTLAFLRESALAIKHTSLFATSFHDKEISRDRTGRSGLHRDALSEMRVLGETATKALVELKGHVQKLKEMLAEGGWLDRVLNLCFEKGGDVEKAVEGVVGGREEAEEWVGRVVESWREGVKGWGMVRWE